IAACFVGWQHVVEFRHREHDARLHQLGRLEPDGPEIEPPLAAAANGAEQLDEDQQHDQPDIGRERSEEHTSELQSLMRITYAVFCLKQKKKYKPTIQSK